MGLGMLGVGTALAGPPLLCHPFEIETARSLPWDAAPGWMGRPGVVELKTLVADTEALLTADAPIVVRMETLRRAAIYAGRDEQVAAQLLARLRARAEAAGKNGQPDALAMFDAGYLIETYREIGKTSRYGEDDRIPGWKAKEVGSLVANLDGTALVQRSLAARAGDPAIELASALIAASSNRKADYTQHARRARAGATKDALLARNLGLISGTD
jgi:hypothetical protein